MPSSAPAAEQRALPAGAPDATDQVAALPRVLLAGHPNVGKSLLFNDLTGAYATVSNYPGTTVEIMRGTVTRLPGYEVCDTPGAYSLLPITDEERVTRDVLLAALPADVIVHVVDAKSLRRMLPMTIELLELGLPTVLVLNLMDEARHLHVRIDTTVLSELLGGIPVVETVATTGEGVADLIRVIRDGVKPCAPPVVDYGDTIQTLQDTLRADNAEAALQTNPTLLLAAEEAAELDAERLGNLELAVRRARQTTADSLLSRCATFPPPPRGALATAFDRITLNMWTAVPLAALVVYLGVYQFVGVFGAGFLVDKIENGLYNAYITPWLETWIPKLFTAKTIQDLLVYDYGVLTLGLRYAIALILPIVGTFFILFSVLEDTGYLPRLALLLDKAFKKIGLNGRAVIPIVLGFGCGTMATMVTRILETKRERLIATLLLGVAVPCTAQLGVVLGLLSQNAGALIAWGVVMTLIFGTVGLIAARTMPGEAPSFYLELPPLRLPRLRNVMVKTYSRMHWYFLEVLPLFLFASVVIWAGKLTGFFDYVVKLMLAPVHLMGLPDETAPALLFGFFRRDYGGAGLLELQHSGGLNGRQLFVSVLVVSLLLPCVAQFMIMKKERGWKFAVTASVSIVLGAFVCGVLANALLSLTGWLG